MQDPLEDDHTQYALLSGRDEDSLNIGQINAYDKDGLKLYDDKDNGIFIEDGGNVGIGTTSPSAALDIDGNLTINSSGQVTAGEWQGSAIDSQYGGTGMDTSDSTGVATISSGTWSVDSQLGVTLGGTGTDTQFTKGSLIFAGEDGVYSQNNSNLFWDDGDNYLGIGNPSPEAALHIGTQSPSGLTSSGDSVMISGELEVSETFYAGPTEFAADAGVIAWTDMPVTSSASAGTIQSYTSYLDGNPMLTVYSEADGSGGIQNQGIGINEMNPAGLLHIGATSPFVVDSAGNVGIGTTNPSYKLDVPGEVRLANVSIGNSYIKFSGVANKKLYADGDYNNSVNYFMRSGVHGWEFDDYSSGTRGFWNFMGTMKEHSSTEISGDASLVGVNMTPTFGGTASNFTYNSSNPLTGLGIQPNINISTSSTGNYTALLVNPTESSVGSGATNYLADFQVNGSSKMVIDSSGNVGIGTTSPANKLTVSGGLSVGTTDSTSSYLSTAAPDGGAIFEGSVGIGDTDPSYKLTVDHNGDGVDAAYVNDSNAWTSGSADYAEYYYTEDTDLESGEAVCIDLTRENAVKRCPRQRDPNLMGIVSTSPAFLGNAPAEEKREDNDNYKIIGMLGQVPAKVSDENGQIRSGDSLTSASKPGYLMKAGPGDSTVGVALEKQKDNSQKINVLISRRNQSLTVEQVESQIQDRIAKMEIEDEVDILVSQAINNLSLSETFDFDPEQIAEDIENNTEKIKVINSRLDDYQEEVDDRLTNYESQIANYENEVNSRFEKQDSKLEQQDKRLEELTATVDNLNETDSYLIDLAASNETRISDLETSILEDSLDSETAISARITQILQSLGESLEEEIIDERGNKLFALTADLELINLKAEKVEAEEVEADRGNFKKVKVGAESAGRNKIRAGETEVVVEAPGIMESAKIILTLVGDNQGKTLYVDKIVEDDSFKAKFNKPVVDKDIEFNWFVVESGE